MFRNYLTTTIRALLKNKLYSFINIGGLAIGLAACILILLFVRDEVSYDTWLPNAENIYKLEVTFYPPGRGPIAVSTTPGPVGPTFKEYVDGVEDYVRVYNAGSPVKIDDRQFNEQISYVDASFFDIFDLPMISGDRTRAMTDNLSILMNQELATKYFGDENPIGQTVNISGTYDMTVVGVFADLPRNTSLNFEVIALFDPVRYEDNPWVAQSWLSANLHTFLKVRPGTTKEELEAKFPAVVNEFAVIEIPGFEGIEGSDIQAFDVISVPNLHLYATKPGQLRQAGDIVAVYTFSAVATLILIIASINFMNLATARAMKRAREVSMRKVVGATRRQLISQFLGEAIFTTMLSLIIAIGLVELTLPAYNAFLDKELTLKLLIDPIQTLGIIALAVSVGIFGGSYPAFFISAFRPARVLKANKSAQGGSPFIRQALVVIQFSISIALIVSTAVVYGQTIYARNMDVGWDKDDKIVVYAFSPQLRDSYDSIVQEFKSIPGVLNVTQSSDVLPQNSNNNTLIRIPGVAGDPLVIETMSIGPNFLDVYDINVIAGRSFGEEYRSDFLNVPEDENEQATQGAIVNRSFLSRAGFGSPEEAINKIVLTPVQGLDSERQIEVTIVGVVDDLHVRSVRFEISPMIFFTSEEPLGAITVHMGQGDQRVIAEAVDNAWRNQVPEVPIFRTFVNESFDSLYDAEEQRGQMFAAFSIFAVLVACLGLYGLASFAAEQRTKEIGIRKVMGASITDIVRLLIWQFSKPVVWANIIAWPAAYYVMSDWLTSFEYRIDLNILLFVGAGLIALMIAWLTVAHRAIKVARSKPISALRYE